MTIQIQYNRTDIHLVRDGILILASMEMLFSTLTDFFFLFVRVIKMGKNGLSFPQNLDYLMTEI